MVSPGTVASDAAQIETFFDQYQQCLEAMKNDSIWQGASRDNAYSKGEEFVNEFRSPINEQMSNLASALTKFIEYKKVKAEYEQAKAAYNSAIAAEDNELASHYASIMQEKKQKMESLKGEINALLSSICGVKLTSTNNITGEASPTISANGYASANATIQSAMDWAIAIAEDDSIGYSKPFRNSGKSYDCSSFIISAYQKAGIDVEGAGATFTGNMLEAFTKCGFEWIPGTPNVENLQPGDVLLNQTEHTEMYVGNGMNVGAHDDYSGKEGLQDGDPSGNEINVQAYSDHNWDGVLRYTGK